MEDDDKYIEILKEKVKDYEERNEIKNAIYNTHKIKMYIEEKIAETQEAHKEKIKEVEHLTEKVEIIQESLQKKEEERANIEVECEKLKKEIIKIKEEPVEMSEERRNLIEKIEKCTKEISTLKKELEETKAKNNNITSQFNNYRVNVEHEFELKQSEKNDLLEQIDEMNRKAGETRKLLDKVYSSYENSRTTLDHLLFNNELLKSELIAKQKELYSRDSEFRDLTRAKDVMERSYFTLIKLEKQEYTTIFNDLLGIQIKLKEEANRIDQVVELFSNINYMSG